MNPDTTVARGDLQDLLAFLAQPSPAPAPASAPLAWLKALRAAAVERVGVLQLPNPRDEAWRFTDLSALRKQSFHPLRTPTTLQRGDVDRFFIDEASTRLVFVDGVHAPQLSSPDSEGIACSLAQATPAQIAAIEPHLGAHAVLRGNLFSALNTAFLHDAALVVVPRDTAVAVPLHLLFIATQPGVASHPRVLVVAGAGSAVTVIEDYVSLHDAASGTAGEAAYFTNAITEIVIAANAKVEHVRVQRESADAFHIAACAVALGHASRYHSVSVALGAKLSRLALDVLQGAEGTECTLDGLALIGERQLADTHSFIDHAQPHGTSRQLHKCIVDGAARAVFNGQVMVRHGAQRTDSAQSSRNLLLTGKALVDTQPQLEIYADDVKCTHGATVGQLDPDAVFPAKPRGHAHPAARRLLTYAFGAEVIDRIPVASLRLQLERTVLEHTERLS